MFEQVRESLVKDFVLQSQTISRRRFLQLSTAFSAVALGAGLYTWQCEPHWVEFVRRPLPLPHLPRPLMGKRLIHLSDLHIGPRVDDSYLRHTFERVQSLLPDIIVYTGDFISFEGHRLEHIRRMFRHLPLGRMATLGVLGNHDYGPGWARPHTADTIARLAASAGVRILRNEVAEVHGLRIGGVDDLWARQCHPERILQGSEAGRPTLVLVHNPDTADEPVWEEYRSWILCGHTHGGQCKPPFLPAPLLPVKNRRYRAGEYALTGGRRMYINRGVGHLLQARFNVRPEVTVFQLAQGQTDPEGTTSLKASS